MIKQHFNKVFRDVFSTDARYIDLWGGRARGGSHFATDYFLFLITKPDYFRGYFMRQIHDDIRGSLFQDFKDRIEENPTVNIDDFSIDEGKMKIVYKPTGNIINSRGFKKASSRQTAKLKSIAGATHIIIEEAEEIDEVDFEKLDDSLRTVKVKNIQILRLWNPPGVNHWLIKRHFNTHSTEHDGFFTATPKDQKRHLSVHSTYLHNLRNINESLLEKINEYKNIYYNSNDPYEVDRIKYRYLVQYMGLVPVVSDDLVFKNWTTYDDDPADYDLKLYGIDFGYTNDPTGIVQLIIDNDKKELYLKEICYQRRLTNPMIADLIKESVENYDDYYFVCDNAEPKSITELLTHEINAIPCVKGADSIRNGINKLKNYKLFVHSESDNLQMEFRNYKYQKDIDGNVLNVPEDKYNHLIDPTRYALTKFY